MDLGTVTHVFITAVVLLVMMCILVAAHEYGHYLFARLFGMGVEEFAIGFGKKPIWTWMRRTYSVDPVPGAAGQSVDSFTEQERYDYLTDGSSALKPEPIVEPTPSQVKLSLQETTDFTVRPWPLGGFVRIKGMIPEEDGSEVRVPGGFYSKAPWKRFIVLLAGPVFSVIAGVLILFLQTVILGREVPKNTVLNTVIEKGPAAQAGLKAGDRILSVAGVHIKSAYDVGIALRDMAGKPVQIKFERAGSTQEVAVTPVLEPKPSPILDATGEPTGEMRKQAKMMATWEMTRVPVSAAVALSESAQVPVDMVVGLGRLILKPSQLKDNVGGPISIARATSDAVKLGPGYVIWLSAMLSISVGIFNMLPIPPLDGGQMMVAIAETLRRGKRLSIKVQGTVAAIGFALVLMMFAMVMFIDVGRLTNPTPRSDAKVISKEDK